jgi:hypothetical protein
MMMDTTGPAEYDQRGRILGGDPEQMMDAAAAAYATLSASGTDTLLIAAGHALRRELSRRIRDDLIRLGIVQDGAAVTIAGGARAGPGDLIICTTNDHTAEAGEPGRTLANGDLLRIESVTPAAWWCAAPWTPTRPPGSAAGPARPSPTPATTAPSSATRSPATWPRAAPCTPAWR